MIRLLLVDDHAMFREGLVRTLEREPDCQVVGQCASTIEGLLLLAAATDVVLLDVDLGAGRAMEFVEAAPEAAFPGRILIVTAGISNAEAVQLVHAASPVFRISAGGAVRSDPQDRGRRGPPRRTVSRFALPLRRSPSGSRRTEAHRA